MRQLFAFRALRYIVFLLTFTAGLSLPVRSQSPSDSTPNSRVLRSDPTRSLFTADAQNILASYEEVLGARGLIDVLPVWCPGKHGIAAEKKASTEWFCSEVPNPDGFPGGGSSYLRLFGNDEELFALAALFKDEDPGQLERVQSQLIRSFQKECPCRAGDNAVTYCHCENVEVRLMQQGKGLGLMVISDVERFMTHTLGLEPKQERPERRTSENSSQFSGDSKPPKP